MQGGVRPWWLQGSSVTTTVWTRSSVPAARTAAMAAASAWAVPARRWASIARTDPSASSRQQPTVGVRRGGAAEAARGVDRQPQRGGYILRIVGPGGKDGVGEQQATGPEGDDVDPAPVTGP